MLNDFKKVKRFVKTDTEDLKLSHWTSSQTVEMDDGSTLEDRIKNVDNTSDMDKPISTAQKKAFDLKADLENPSFTGIPTAPTASVENNSDQIATTSFVHTVVSNGIAASDALIFKGTIGTNGTVTELPAVYQTGWTYRVITEGTYAGEACEAGDLIIALADRDGSGNQDSDWCVAQTNIDGAITGIRGDACIDYSQSGSIVTITHKDIPRADTSSAVSPSSGASFTAVKSIISDAKGHITDVETETITLPNTSVMVDDELDSESSNPVQNKVLYQKISNIDNTADADKNVASAVQDGDSNNIVDTYAKRSIYGDSTINIGRRSGTTVGYHSVVLSEDDSYASGTASVVLGGIKNSAAAEYSVVLGGKDNAANGNMSAVSGFSNIADGFSSIVMGGDSNTAGGSYNSVVGGVSNVTQGDRSAIIGGQLNGVYAGYSAVVGGYGNVVSSMNSGILTGYYNETEGSYSAILGGSMNRANGENSAATGDRSVADNYAAFSCGKFNKLMETGGTYRNQVGDAFVIGNGTGVSSRSNALRVTYLGDVMGTKAFQSSGADYAEFIKPWADGNPNNEDRVGYFVTVKNSLLYKANEGDYITGITSGNPSIVGNADEDYYWRYERDEFNRIVMEDVPETVQVKDHDGNPLFDEETHEPFMEETGKIIKNARMKLSENYDPDLQENYIERKNRPEWDYVGMLGVIPVRDDGTCIPGQFCKCGRNGIATLSSERGFDTYMVLERISDNIVSVILK